MALSRVIMPSITIQHILYLAPCTTSTMRNILAAPKLRNFSIGSKLRNIFKPRNISESRNIAAASNSDNISIASNSDNISLAPNPDNTPPVPIPDSITAASRLRGRYTHFRILVIGRANAGKTTLLKRVCNTSEEPCIYDDEGKNLLTETVAVITRGIHDINHPFSFASNPKFIFHDSPGFEAGDEAQLKTVQEFIKKCANATEVDDQLHAIWFCFTPDVSRFLFNLEMDFFNQERAGKAPVIAVFTKFDDFVNQVFDIDLDDDENRTAAETKLAELEVPLYKCKFPPRADMHFNDGAHQEQVKKLIEQTAGSLDNLALELLFVSIQQNNLELCMKYAVKQYILLAIGQFLH
ncbi:hypothetical protein DXG01_012542 [Tephrocybe rancida]|nr:hypothetical protein DXG01_012542 [Tephrocybe rancida]